MERVGASGRTASCRCTCSLLQADALLFLGTRAPERDQLLLDVSMPSLVQTDLLGGAVV